MERILEFLKGVFYIATVDGDQPRVRPFDSAAIIDGKLYFGTADNKKVYDQLIANPKFEIFAMDDTGSLRLTGEALPEKDRVKATEAFKEMGKYHDNPTLVAFFIVGATAIVSTKDGNTEEVKF